MMRHYGKDVGEALGVGLSGGGRVFSEPLVSVLKLAVRYRLSHPEESDPIRVFVKHEPHKKEKLAEGRLRLISAVSLVDTMCDRIMFGGLAKKIVQSVGRTPVMLGWAPLRGGSRFISSRFGKLRTRPVDMRAWDWTVDEKMVLAMKKVIKELFIGAPDSFDYWLEHRWEQLFRHAVFQFGDGTAVQQPGWGIMKSGCYLTIVLNSIGQLLAHYDVLESLGLVGDYRKVIMGDDRTIQDFPEFELYRQRTIERGYLMKPTEATDDVYFCGFIFRDGFSWPEYRDKHCYVITHTPLDKLAELLQSYQLLYAHVPRMLSFIRLELMKIDPRLVMSDRELQTVYDS